MELTYPRSCQAHSGISCSKLIYCLLNHSLMASILFAKVSPTIDFLHGFFRPPSGIPLVLGEIGSKLGGDTSMTNTISAALWPTDLLLYSSSFGARSMAMQLGDGFEIAAWQPHDILSSNGTVVKEQEEQAGSYGMAFAADFVGKGADFYDFKVHRLVEREGLAVYAGYR